jgi:putative phage-type endonuclease
LSYLPSASFGHPHFTVVDLDQNSDAWLAWRRTGLGSSDAPAVLGESPWKTREELFQEKLVEFHGHKAPLSTAQFHTIRKAMAAREAKNDTAKNRGKKLEAPARAEFEALTGLSMPAVCGHHAHKEHLKVSLDGWHGGRKEFLEVKCPNQKAHGEALSGVVPSYYRAQLLHQMLVSGAAAGWYESFHDKFPPGQRVALVYVSPATSRAVLGYDGQYEAPLPELVEALGALEDEFWLGVVTGEYRPL